jgi:hypothetical protein
LSIIAPGRPAQSAAVGRFGAEHAPAAGARQSAASD